MIYQLKKLQKKFSKKDKIGNAVHNIHELTNKKTKRILIFIKLNSLKIGFFGDKQKLFSGREKQSIIRLKKKYFWDYLMSKQFFFVTFISMCAVVSTQAQSAAVKKQILNRIIQFGGITREEVKERGGVNRILSIQSVDLNRDGKPEYMVICDCSLGGTPFVFRQTKKGVKDIFVGVVRETVTLSKGYTKGWRNLEYEEPYSPGYQAQPLRFNGSRYKK